MKKLLTVILILTALVALGSISVFADEIEETAEATDGVGGTENLFAEIYSAIIENGDTVLSALAFGGSLILALAYKKGLLPMLKGALGSLGSAVSKLKEETGAASERASEAISAATEKLSAAEELVRLLGERLEQLESELSAAREEQTKTSDIKIIISAQIDMLYEVFMSSSLPLYQKEAIGEKISAMRKTLAPEVSEDE